MLNRTVKFVANGQRCAVTVTVRPWRGGDLAAPKGLTVDLEPISPGSLELSITGECAGSAGQCIDSIREAGEGVADIQRLCDLWSRWHLNGLKAGTRAQNEHVATLPEDATHDGRKASLIANGLQPDKGYSYGSAWLYEPLPESVVAELTAILARLNGARLGDTPDLDDAPEIGGDMIDSRDVIARLEIYRAAVEAMGVDADSVTAATMPEDVSGADEDTILEFIALRDLDKAGDSYAGDWSFGATMIGDSYFEEHAKELAEDCGMVNKDAAWPNNHIDWEAAAYELQGDYTSIEYKGKTYWIR